MFNFLKWIYSMICLYSYLYERKTFASARHLDPIINEKDSIVVVLRYNRTHLNLHKQSMSKTVACSMIEMLKNIRFLHLRTVLGMHCGFLVCSVFHKLIERKCVCCQELVDVVRILSQESVRLTCIVDHPEFTTVCLNLLVLCVDLAGSVAMRGCCL